jgi:hypothetical protein
MAGHGLVPQSYDNAKVVTTHDTNLNEFSAFFVGVAGAVAFQNVLGTTITLAAVPAYTVIPVATKRIMATGTAATNIIGLS